MPVAAYIAGLIISNVQRSTYLESKFDTMSYLLLSPVFFASIGLKVELPKMSMTIIAFAVVLTIVAVITKIIGCGLGAKVCGYKNYQVKRIGVGMISRGEVALIVASKGAALGLMSSALLGPRRRRCSSNSKRRPKPIRRPSSTSRSRARHRTWCSRTESSPSRSPRRVVRWPRPSSRTMWCTAWRESRR